MPENYLSLREKIRGCKICADRFAKTHTAHTPNPVVWFKPNARILIAGQAPGARVYRSGQPFTDPSGDRLRVWLGMDEDTFYDQDRVAIVPMAFCFPGYSKAGSALPPPPICAKTWHDQVMEILQSIELAVLVGSAAHKWHLETRSSVTETVQRWRDHAPRVFPLPHPSWRNTAWLRRNPWFEAEVLPDLRQRVTEVLAE